MSWLVRSGLVVSWMAGALVLGACGTREAVMPGQETGAEVRVQSAGDVAGFWRILPSEPGAKGGCQIALNTLVEAGRHGVHIETCAIPALARARTWRLAGQGFELLDEAGTVIAAFRKTAVDRFVSIDGAYRMEPQPVA